MRFRKSAAILALMTATLCLSACYDNGRPGHDSDRHGHHHRGDRDHDDHDHGDHYPNP